MEKFSALFPSAFIKTLGGTITFVTCALATLAVRAFPSPFSLTLEAAHPQLQAQQKCRSYVQLTLQAEKPTSMKRVPLNLCIALDTSASMGGGPISHAKAALKAIVKRLKSEDRLSIVTFDGRARLVLPPTNPRLVQKINDAIESISTGGPTAMFAGLKLAAKQLNSSHRANRIILLADGAANVGLMHPLDFKRLGRKLGYRGISVTTLGLGKSYDEDMLAHLAHQSGGNHAFVAGQDDIGPVLEREFSHALTMVAADISVKVRFAPFVKPLRVLGQRAKIKGREVELSFGRLYGCQYKGAIIEVQIFPQAATERVLLAAARVTGYGKAEAFVQLVAPTTRTRAEQLYSALTNCVGWVRGTSRRQVKQGPYYDKQSTIAGTPESYVLYTRERLNEYVRESRKPD